jgi:hypothetical protein
VRFHVAARTNADCGLAHGVGDGECSIIAGLGDGECSIIAGLGDGECSIIAPLGDGDEEPDPATPPQAAVSMRAVTANSANRLICHLPGIEPSRAWPAVTVARPRYRRVTRSADL